MNISNIWNIYNYFFRKNFIGVAYVGLYDYDDDLYNKSIEEIKGDFLQKSHFLGQDVKIHPRKINNILLN